MTGVDAVHENGETRQFPGDYVFSTMPIKELIRAFDTPVPENIREISDGLIYRDFITVGMLLNRLQIKEDSEAGGRLLKDNWIYIQEPDVLVGRMQIFNNWSPYMVADPTKAWIGLEYFCYDDGRSLEEADEEMIALAKEEMERIGIIATADVWMRR